MRTCTHCRRSGHNKRTCPHLTKKIEERYKTASNKRDKEYWARRLADRTGTNPLSGKKQTRKSSKRRCSYCKCLYGPYSDKALGHNRRSCNLLKKHKTEEYTKNSAYRRQVVAAMKREGVGVGAVLHLPVADYYLVAGTDEKRWEKRWMPYLVVSINWDAICDCYGPHARPLNLVRLDLVGRDLYQQRSRTATLPVLRKEGSTEKIQTSRGFQTGDWFSGGRAPGRDYIGITGNETHVLTRCPPSGFNTVPTDFHSGRSLLTDQWLNARRS